MENKDQLTARLEKKLVFATGKEITFLEAARLLGLSHVAFFNPETPGQETFQQEPLSSDSLESVMFKLSRALELFIPHEEDKTTEEHIFIATDVVYSVKRNQEVDEEFLHKLIRKAEDRQSLDEDKEKQRLVELYAKSDFVARWQLAIGTAENQKITMGVVTIVAEFAPLTLEEINKHFDPDSNSGMQMVEVGIDRGIDFKIMLADGAEPIVCNTPELRELVKQLIVIKVPTEPMLHTLYKADLQQHPQQYGLISFAAKDLFSRPL